MKGLTTIAALPGSGSGHALALRAETPSPSAAEPAQDIWRELNLDAVVQLQDAAALAAEPYRYYPGSPSPNFGRHSNSLEDPGHCHAVVFPAGYQFRGQDSPEVVAQHRRMSERSMKELEEQLGVPQIAGSVRSVSGEEARRRIAEHQLRSAVYHRADGHTLSPEECRELGERMAAAIARRKYL